MSRSVSMLMIVPLLFLFATCTDLERAGPLEVSALADARAGTSTVESGCATFGVRLTGRNGIEVVAVDREGCGGLVPVLAGEAQFERTEGRVRIPIGLRNESERTLRQPVSLFGWADSLRVAAPNGLGKNHHSASYLAFAEADSILADDDATRPGAFLWSYDERLREEEAALPAGAETEPRWIEIEVRDGVRSFEVTLHAEARAGASVPALAPDSVPEWIYNLDNRIYDIRNGDTVATYVRNVIIIYFDLDAPQEQRQQAVEAVNGTVIGGRARGPWRDGPYYVLVDPQDSPDGLFSLARAVRGLPGVMSATGVGIASPYDVVHYRLPRDGGGYGHDDWQVHPSSTSTGPYDYRWGLEAIAAPLAWGCETGEGVPIGVVDWGFTIHEDLTANVSHAHGAGIHPIDGHVYNHGTMIASIIGAASDNGRGITGVAWRPDLRVYDFTSDAEGNVVLREDGQPDFDPVPLAEYITQAALHGSAVINLSSGVPWSHVPGDDESADLEWAEVWTAPVRHALVALRSRGIMPLLVVSAGNTGTDAKWSGIGALSLEFPDQIITVANATRAPNPDHPFLLDAHSNRNVSTPIVEIASPGTRTGSLDGHGALRVAGQTSAAAAFVTGVAGLLKSFDPRLETSEIKELLVEGSRLGGFRVHSAVNDVYLLNAWESLKLAAQREGAPLCGNLLWYDDGAVYAARTAGVHTVPEELFRVPGDLVGGLFAPIINPLHGGDAILLRRPHTSDPWTTFARVQSEAGPVRWIRSSATVTEQWPDGSSASLLSRNQFTHDREQGMWSRRIPVGVGETIEFMAYDPDTMEELVSGSTTTRARPGERLCLRRFGQVIEADLEGDSEYDVERRDAWSRVVAALEASPCRQYTTQHAGRLAANERIAPAPDGSYAILSIWFEETTIGVGSWSACDDRGPISFYDSVYQRTFLVSAHLRYHCRAYSAGIRSVPGEYRRIDLDTGAVTASDLLGNHLLLWSVGIGEGNTSAVLQSRTRAYSNAGQWVPHQGLWSTYRLDSSATSSSTCTQVAWDIPQRRVISEAPAGSCSDAVVLQSTGDWSQGLEGRNPMGHVGTQ